MVAKSSTKKKSAFSSPAEAIKRLKVAIYIRVSTHWQVDKDSLKVQRRELIAYAEMVLGIKDYVIFEDPGYSAKNTDRPDYQNMMDRMRTGEFSHLLVWKIDRISRNLLDFAEMYAGLKRSGITFVSKNEQFDTSNAIGEAMLKIILVFAELERQMTSERVTAVMLSRATNGQWNGGRIPYGYAYDKKDKVFSVDEIEGKVVHRIFDLYEQHQSTLYVARYLNEAGISTRNGDWSSTGIHTILTNPFYIGSYRYNVHTDGSATDKKDESEWVLSEDHHVPIIDVEQFDRVQYRLKRKKRGGNQSGESRSRIHLHVFAGLLQCSDCGSLMTATPGKMRASGWSPSTYGCSKRRKAAGGCQSKFVSDVGIGPFVFNFIANIIRAQKSITPGMSQASLEKKLLRGDAFQGVAHLAPESLAQIQSVLLSGSTGMEYQSSSIGQSDGVLNERERLITQRRKKETAISRLKSLYLYGDEELPEKDFIVERKQLMDDIEEINRRLSEIKEAEADSLGSNEMIEKASYFIMVENLLEDRNVDYEKYIRRIDPEIPKTFLNNIIDRIIISDGRISSIKFKNGLTQSFVYSD